MPTLQFKGKNIIWNHHLSVPYHTLEEIKDLHFQPEKSNGNIIVEGDNLLALKALLPEYAGKVKFIYIDPPYNTGNEGWIYNDNVNSPLINKWLGEEVGAEDLNKHDKWLCMMAPRLKLLRDLLSDNGLIFISIGEHEVGNLKNLCDEILFSENLVTVLSWKSRAKPTNAGNAKYRPQKVAEFILVYSKSNPEDILFKLSSGIERNYNYSDKKGKYRLTTILTSNLGVYKRETMRFEVNNFKPSEEQRWKAGEDEINDLFETGRLQFNSDGIPMWKKYEQDEDELLSPMYSFIDPELSGTAENGKSEVNKLLGKGHGFDTIKPVNLIKYLIHISTEKDDIILDSFAGTGTTAQEVLEINKEDEGNRQFIMVQMKEETSKDPTKNICENITRKRINEAINKYNFQSGFKYFKVGSAIDPEKMLEGVLPKYEDFAKYIYYLGTGVHLAEIKSINAKTHFVGNHSAKDFFLIYQQDLDTLAKLALNLHIAEEIVKESPAKRRVVYAPACFLDSEYMEDNQIEFVSIPYNLFEREANS